jgi:hypothetical protein
MPAVVYRSSSKGVEEFKGFKEFELLGRWEDQILPVHRCGWESSRWPGPTLIPTPPKGYPALCPGERLLVASDGVLPSLHAWGEGLGVRGITIGELAG